MSEKTTIGGRSFHEIGFSTCAHDTWTMGMFTRAGLQGIGLLPGETHDEFSWRVLGTVLKSGLLYELLGGFLVPEGTDDLAWTPELAAETGRFIGELYKPEDKAEVHRLVAALLLPFLRDGIGSFATSPSSSPAGPTGEATSEASTTSANGEG